MVIAQALGVGTDDAIHAFQLLVVDLGLRIAFAVVGELGFVLAPGQGPQKPAGFVWR